jgi:hypothetical protein
MSNEQVDSPLLDCHYRIILLSLDVDKKEKTIQNKDGHS